jgi:multidrug resistance efflux pump
MNQKSTITKTVLLFWGLTWAAEAQEMVPDLGVISLRHCDITFERTSQIGAILDGSTGDAVSVIQDCYVTLGDRVKENQVLARLQHRAIDADLVAGKKQAENRLYIENAEALYSQAKLQAERGKVLMAKRAIAPLDYSLLMVDETVAALAIDQAKFDLTQAQIRYDRVVARFRNLEYRAPHDGLIVECTKSLGERVMATEAPFVIVDDSHVLVTGQLDIINAWDVHPGQKARVMPEIEGADLPIEREVFEGVVIFVDNRIDPQPYSPLSVVASGVAEKNVPQESPKSMASRVIVRVANRGNLLRSGLVARMEIQTNKKTAKAPSPHSPTTLKGVGATAKDFTQR